MLEPVGGYLAVVYRGGVLRVLEHPHQLWHKIQLSSSVTIIGPDNR